MRLRWCSLIPALSTAILLAAVAVAQSETWPLDLKRLESRDPSNSNFDRTDYIYRTTYPQHFFLQKVPDGKGGVRSVGNEPQAAEFKKLVKKEPEYQSKEPFKGVAKLGTRQYVFALDTSKPESKAKDGKPAEETDKEKAAPQADSAIAKLKEMLTQTKAAPPTPPTPAYDRLYFDFNHNGDLTDDKVVEGDVKTGSYSPQQSYAQISFPRLEVAIDADGTPVESAFFLSGHASSSSNFSYIQVQINAGAYREGEITLDGKKRHVVLIDFNSNGRFDDEMKIRKEVHGSQGQLYPEQGDMLLVDPEQNKEVFGSPYDVTSADYRHNVSKLLNIDGRFYDMKVTPAGDQLSLEPSSVALGNVTNPNDGFRALIYSDAGFLKISGNKGTALPVPAGEWKLLSYTINLAEAPKPVEPAKKEAKQADQETSVLDSLKATLQALMGDTSGPSLARPRLSIVSAQATNDYKPVKVAEGETVELPFGPPYKPVVTAQTYGDLKQVKQTNLAMSLVGSAGEICSNMMVGNGRPPKPQFTITDPKGEVVLEGSFEYG